MSDPKKRDELSPRQRKALEAYGHWRPRVGRGVQAGTAAGILTSLTRQKKRSPEAAAAGFGLGVLDKMLEEKAGKSRQVAKAVGEGFHQKKASPWDSVDQHGHLSSDAMERHDDNQNGVLQALFGKKARTSSLAKKQLGGLFPESEDRHYGQSATVSAPAGSVSQVFSRSLKG